jgi:hypothetical protein
MVFLLLSESAPEREILTLIPHWLFLGLLGLILRVYAPVLIGPVVTGVHVDIAIIEVVVQTIFVMLSLQVPPIEEPFLIGTVMALVHIYIAIVVIIVQALTVVIRLHMLSVEMPLLITTIMATMHVYIAGIVVIVQARVVMIGLEMSMRRLRLSNRASDRLATWVVYWVWQNRTEFGSVPAFQCVGLWIRSFNFVCAPVLHDAVSLLTCVLHLVHEIRNRWCGLHGRGRLTFVRMRRSHNQSSASVCTWCRLNQCRCRLWARLQIYRFDVIGGGATATLNALKLLLFTERPIFRAPELESGGGQAPVQRVPNVSRRRELTPKARAPLDCPMWHLRRFPTINCSTSVAWNVQLPIGFALDHKRVGIVLIFVGRKPWIAIDCNLLWEDNLAHGDLIEFCVAAKGVGVAGDFAVFRLTR